MGYLALKSRWWHFENPMMLLDCALWHPEIWDAGGKSHLGGNGRNSWFWLLWVCWPGWQKTWQIYPNICQKPGQAAVFKKVESNVFDYDAINVARQNVSELNWGLGIIIELQCMFYQSRLWISRVRNMTENLKREDMMEGKLHISSLWITDVWTHNSSGLIGSCRSDLLSFCQVWIS